MTQETAKYNNSPVIETVLGVEFKPLIQWQIPHFGLYWNRIRSNYQLYAVQPPLPGQVEKFGEEVNTLTITLGSQPEARCWFFDNKQDWLLQVQNNRFLSNWKRKTPAYPKYKGFCERFDKQWGKFNEFLKSENLGEPELLQCEVTYINHIDVDVDFNDLCKIFPVWNGFKKGGFLPAPEAIAINSTFVIPENIGRLYIVMQPVVRHTDIKIVIQLSVTAKVKIASNSNHAMSEALKTAHEWCVNGFTDFTSEQMHDIWQKKQ